MRNEGESDTGGNEMVIVKGGKYKVGFKDVVGLKAQMRKWISVVIRLFSFYLSSEVPLKQN